MLTRKGAILGALLVAACTIALLTRAWVLALALLPLALAMSAGFARALLAPPRLRARAALARTRLLALDEEPVEVALANEGGRTPLVEVALDLHPFVEAREGARAGLRRLARGHEARMRFLLRAPVRGRFPLGDVVVRERGVAGLFAREQRVPLGARLEVLPRWEEVEAIPALARRYQPTVGTVATGRTGAGQEFYGLRRYLPGDPITSVNWRQTAKLRRPIVNEYEHEAPARLVLALDARRGARVGAGYHNTFESSIRAVLSLSWRAQRERLKVGFLLMGDRLEWIHPGTGRRQHEHIAQRLVDAYCAGDYLLGHALQSLPGNVLPRGASLVLVTPAYADATLPTLIDTTAARGARLVVVSPSPESAELAAGELDPTARAAARVLMLQRRRQMEGLRARGAVVIDWDVREPLTEALAREEARLR